MLHQLNVYFCFLVSAKYLQFLLKFTLVVSTAFQEKKRQNLNSDSFHWYDNEMSLISALIFQVS